MTAPEKKIEPRRLKGFRDFMPDLMETRSRFQTVIRDHARMAGFREIGTPVLEYAETLLGQGSDETDKQVYRFEDHGQRKVAMRFDLTVPFARFVAEHQGALIFPFKRLQIGDVWRGENTQKGRYREFCQCDLDIIGVDSVAADIEILACFYRILCGFNLGGFTMRLGHRVLLSAMLTRVFPGISESGEAEALIILDKLDKIGQDAVVSLLAKIESATELGAQRLIEVLQATDAEGGTDRSAVRSLLAGHDAGLRELHRMETILAALNATSSTTIGGAVRMDLSIARGLSYYTGVVFETTLDALPGFGSISSGGRYNDLAERFTNRSLPGVGGSIGLDRLLAGLEEVGRIPKQLATPVFIAIATDDAMIAASLLATELRQNSIACDIGLSAGKLGNQFKHADRLGCRYVITLGTSEIETNSYNLKDMVDGQEQKSLPRRDAVLHLRKLLQGA
jgi:histidyl-tRNA synthetase